MEGSLIGVIQGDIRSLDYGSYRGSVLVRGRGSTT